MIKTKNKTQKTDSIKDLLEFSIINLDKPAGITSFKCVEKIKKILKIHKAGHFGTLDPKVTGVLPIAINRACKLSDYFMKKDKEYIGKMYVHKKISKAQLEKEMNEFVGTITQKPPVKSRVKRVFRKRTVNRFEILSIEKLSQNNKGLIVYFHSDVQAGTYIRKLISDLGEKIGGAHMVELRRIRAGIFKISNSVKFYEIYNAFKDYKKGNEQLLKKILIPAEIIKEIVTSIQVKQKSIRDLLNGKPLMKDDLKNKIPNSRLISLFYKKNFIGIYKIINDSKLIAKPEFVKN